jgi:hypothetical protein
MVNGLSRSSVATRRITLPKPPRSDEARYCAVGDRSLKIVELSRQSWYALGAQRHLLAEIIDHYDLELIENRFVAPRKPAAIARTRELFPRS